MAKSSRIVWLIPLSITIGILIGIFIIPKNIDITFEVKNGTREWWDEGIWIDNLQNFTASFNSTPYYCCYPEECPEARRNPKKCTCEYLVRCFNDVD